MISELLVVVVRERKLDLCTHGSRKPGLGLDVL